MESLTFQTVQVSSFRVSSSSSSSYGGAAPKGVALLPRHGRGFLRRSLLHPSLRRRPSPPLSRGVAPSAIAVTASSLSSSPSSSTVAMHPSAAEAARTLVELCMDGALCTVGEDGWPLATSARFALDTLGNPIFRLAPSSLPARNLLADSRCSLHTQMSQLSHRKPQCTLQGKAIKASDSIQQEKLQAAWRARFPDDIDEDECFFAMDVQQVLQSSDMGEEEILVPGSEYKSAVADPLRECAAKIVEDMNMIHWEDIRRFGNVYGHLDQEVEEAHITWVDRLGFDMRVLVKSQEIVALRIPFSRVVWDERDARSCLLMMAQIAWEYERNYNPPEMQAIGK